MWLSYEERRKPKNDDRKRKGPSFAQLRKGVLDRIPARPAPAREFENPLERLEHVNNILRVAKIDFNETRARRLKKRAQARTFALAN